MGGLDRDAVEEEDGDGTRVRAPSVKLGPLVRMSWDVEGLVEASDGCEACCARRGLSLSDDERDGAGGWSRLSGGGGCWSVGSSCRRGEASADSGGVIWRFRDFRLSWRDVVPRAEEGRLGWGLYSEWMGLRMGDSGNFSSTIGGGCGGSSIGGRGSNEVRRL